MKPQVFYLLVIVFTGCVSDFTLEDTSISTEELIELNQNLNDYINSINVGAIQKLTSAYDSNEDFINNSTAEEKKSLVTLIGKSNINPVILDKLKLIKGKEQRDEFKQRYFDIFSAEDNSGLSNGRTENCYTDCWAYSTEIWFDTYMSTESYQAADTAMNLWYAGCSTGCTFALK